MYTSYFRTIYEIVHEYKKNQAKIEREFAYQRTIVCSIPVQKIGSEQMSIPATNRCEPG